MPAGNGKTAQCSPGAVILSGVFNQDGSDAPYLQPIVVNFNPTLKTNSPTPSQIPTFTSRTFFQLYNQYDCANAQLLSIEDGPIQYNVLMGGVSFFYITDDIGKHCYLISVNACFVQRLCQLIRSLPCSPLPSPMTFLLSRWTIQILHK